MMDAVKGYLSLRRKAGFDMSNAEYLLVSFARFAAERSETHIRTQTAIDWAALGPSVAQRDARLKSVCLFARHMRVEDGRHELPPANHFGYRKKRRLPYIYSRRAINGLIEAAVQLGSPSEPRSQTYATLLALLATTGLRISEALALRFSDITADGLLIRETKFHKTRLVPLHDTAVAGLERYLRRRRQLTSYDDHVFIGDHGRPLQYQTVQSTFKRLLKKADLWPANGRRPHLHDFRHAFAVRALQVSPAGRGRIGQHMTALATYLGHVNIYATYWYLEAVPDLLQDIAEVGESFMSGEHSHDPDRPPCRSLPPGDSHSAERRQPAHVRFLCSQLPATIRVRCSEIQDRTVVAGD
jgi:integrase